jgi:1,4-dihydroxy-2-naphthoyl-CoA hydrolase
VVMQRSTIFPRVHKASQGFTTIELTTNFIGTALKGDVTCVVRLVHKGRSTQVWDAEVISDETGQKVAFFRCTQMILWTKG